MERNQLNICWNVYPIYNMNVDDDFENNIMIVDYNMKELGFWNYLFIGDIKCKDKKFVTAQVRLLRKKD